MGHESLGAERSHPRGVVPDLGGWNCGDAISHRPRDLRTVFLTRRGICGQRFAGARGRTARADPQTLTSGAVVSLDYGSLDVYAALYGIPAQARDAVQLGDLSLDRRQRADGIGYLSC